MSSAKTNYAQIEKETLGAIFGCEKFHQYIYGRPAVLETDHKPLLAIAKKSLSDAPPWLQKLLLRLQKYDLTFEFTPGKHLIMADALSRTSLSDRGGHSCEHDVQIHVNTVRAELPVSEGRWAQIAIETEKDDIL